MSTDDLLVPPANATAPFELTMTLPLPCGCPKTFSATTQLPVFSHGPLTMPHPSALHDIAMLCAHTLIERYAEGAACVDPFPPCPNGTPGHDDINQLTGWAAPPSEPNAPSTTTKQ